MASALVPAYPAFRMGKHLRSGDEQRAQIEPLTAAEAHQLVMAAQTHVPELAPFFLMAAGPQDGAEGREPESGALSRQRPPDAPVPDAQVIFESLRCACERYFFVNEKYDCR